MYCKYKTAAAGATAQTLLDDLIAILTGTTDVNLLSAGCDKAASAIYTTYDVAGWTLFDNVSATSKVLSAPFGDDATQIKYLQLDISGSSLRVYGWESWNSTTHVGTNVFLSAVSFVTISAAVDYNIYANARSIVFKGASNDGFVTFESTRGHWPPYAIGTGYKPWSVTASASTWNGAGVFPGGAMCRAVGSGGNPGTLIATLSRYNAESITASNCPRNAAGQPIAFLWPLIAASGMSNGGNYLSPSGEVSSINKLWHCFNVLPYDELTVGSVTYIAIPIPTASATTGTLTVPKG